jgi:hypothetical protein
MYATSGKDISTVTTNITCAARSQNRFVLNIAFEAQDVRVIKMTGSGLEELSSTPIRGTVYIM